MITGLPEESDEDVTESIELLEKLKKHNCFLFVLPFISMGGLRNNAEMRIAAVHLIDIWMIL